MHDTALFIYDLNTLDNLDIERACALDAWLEKIFGVRWRQLKRSTQIDYEIRAQTPKSLWSFFLVATGIARKIAVSLQSANEAIEEWTHNPLTHTSIENLSIEEGRLALPLDHESIRDNLKTASHPSINNVTLRGYDSSDTLSDFKGTLTQAILLLKEADPVSFEMFNKRCGAVCYMKTEPVRQVGECVSLTSKLVPGLIYMTPVPTILTTESIVHEASHLYLTAVERLHDLYQSDGIILKTPLRPDPRPISGLMHQVWVLINLVRLYGGIQKLNTDLIERNAENIKKRANLHRDQLTEGLTLMQENNNLLTHHGKILLSSITSKADNLR